MRRSDPEEQARSPRAEGSGLGQGRPRRHGGIRVEQHVGRVKLRDGFVTRFGKNPHFDIAAILGLELLVGLMEKDGRIKDIRWMAHRLATACLETTIRKANPRPYWTSGASHEP